LLADFLATLERMRKNKAVFIESIADMRNSVDETIEKLRA
jgi:hypothetical protein